MPHTYTHTATVSVEFQCGWSYGFMDAPSTITIQTPQGFWGKQIQP